ncbi:MAG: hypothetical protein FJ086_00240 [Deltaproteobacteria bacterium]|nr:hypothetical protein [Deltaproteobacteria bacterium]
MSGGEDKDGGRRALSLVLSIVAMGLTYGGQLLLVLVVVLVGPEDLRRLVSGKGMAEGLLWAAFALPGAAAGLGAWWPWRAVLGPVGLLLVSGAGAACCAAPQWAWMALRLQVPAGVWMALPPATTFGLALWLAQRRRPSPPAQPPA